MPQSLRERFGALRNLPPFLRLVWQTNPTLTLAQCALRLVRALLPVVTLYVGKLIIDEVVALTQTAGAPQSVGEWLQQGLLDRILWLLALEFGLAVLSDVLGRTVSYFDSLLGEQISQRDEPAGDGARGNARSGGLRGQRAAGPAGARAPAGGRTDDVDRAAARAGAGRRDDRHLRRGPHRLRAVAHRAARHRARPGVRRRGAFQRALLRAQLHAHARAARDRLRAADRSERRNGEGGEDIRLERVPDRALPRARRELLRGEPQALAAAGDRGQRAHGDRHDRLLRRVRLHRVANAASRFHDRRSDLPRRFVPPAAHLAREPADGLFADRRAGAVSRRSVLVLRDPAGDRVSARRATVSGADPQGLRVRGCRIPLSRRRALGGAPPELHAAGWRGAGAGRRERRRQDDAGEADRAPLRSGRGTHPARRL